MIKNIQLHTLLRGITHFPLRPSSRAPLKKGKNNKEKDRGGGEMIITPWMDPTWFERSTPEVHSAMTSGANSPLATSTYTPAGSRLRFPSTGMKGSFARVLPVPSPLILLVASNSTSQLPAPAPTAHSPAQPS